MTKPQGYVQRQISGWSERYDKALTPDAPRWHAVKDWLQANMPADHPTPAIVHNDYRFDNVILDPADPMQIHTPGIYVDRIICGTFEKRIEQLTERS